MNLKGFKTVVLTLVIVLISAIAFYGFYTFKGGVWNNVIPEFKKGMELSAIRELRFDLSNNEEEKEVYLDAQGNVSGVVASNDAENSTDPVSLQSTETETENPTSTTEVTKPEQVQAMENRLANYKVEKKNIKENEDSAKNIENYELAKQIIQKRLESSNSYEYNIRQDSITGELIVEVPDDETVSEVQGFVEIPGKFSIVDYQTGLVLMDDSHVISVSAQTQLDSSSETEQYTNYLSVKLDASGKQILNEISKQYQNIKDSAGEEKTYYISVNLDDDALITTYFGEELNSNIFSFPVGSSYSTYEEAQTALEGVNNIAEVIESGTLPLKYEMSKDNYIVTEVSNQIKLISAIVLVVAILAISIFFVVKYKLNGLKCAIYAIGYIALLSLLIRYTNVYLTINSVIAFICMIVLNYVFNLKLLKNIEKENNVRRALLNTLKEFYIMVIPVCIVAFVFTFRAALIINSVGMMLFWGLVLLAIYNAIMFCI